MSLFAVTFENLIAVAIAASISGVGVTAVFSLALLGAARSIESRREGRPALAWTTLAIAAGAAVLAAVAAGIIAVAA
jgi:hypothetical protein